MILKKSRQIGSQILYTVGCHPRL